MRLHPHRVPTAGRAAACVGRQLLGHQPTGDRVTGPVTGGGAQQDSGAAPASAAASTALREHWRHNLPQFAAMLAAVPDWCNSCIAVMSTWCGWHGIVCLHVVAASAVQALLAGTVQTRFIRLALRQASRREVSTLHAQLRAQLTTRRYHQNQLARKIWQLLHCIPNWGEMHHDAQPAGWRTHASVGFSSRAGGFTGQGRLQLLRACNMSKQLASGACSEGLAKVGTELGRQRLLPVVDGRQAAVEEAQDLRRWIGGPYSTARLQQRAFAPSVAACNRQCSPRQRR